MRLLVAVLLAFATCPRRSVPPMEPYAPAPDPAEEARRAALEQDRRARERQVEADLLQAETETQAQLAAWRADPYVRNTALSARLCRYAVWREAMLEGARREKRYGDEVGVIDLHLLNQVKIVIEEIDAAAAAYRSKFTEARIAPTRCSDPTVAKVARCMSVQAGGGFRPRWVYSADDGADCSETEPFLAVLSQ